MAIPDTASSHVASAEHVLITRKLPSVPVITNVHRPTLANLSLSAVAPPATTNKQLPRQIDSILASAAADRRHQICSAASPAATTTRASTPPRLPSIRSRFAEQTQSAHQIKDLAARLALLLHARECCQGDTSCGVPNCAIARGVLDHCQECFLADGACHTSCAQAKHLLRHFRICRARGFPTACAICSTFRFECSWAAQHVASLTPLFLETTHRAQQSTLLTPLISSSSSDCSSSDAAAITGPVTLRRVVSDDPTLQRKRQASPLPLLSTKRQRFRSEHM